jgi:hypothetical protein
VSSTQLHLLHGNSGIAFSSRYFAVVLLAGGFYLPAVLRQRPVVASESLLPSTFAAICNGIEASRRKQYNPSHERESPLISIARYC